MKVVRETIVAGKTVLQTIKAVTRTYEKGERRTKKINPTPEAVKKVNERLAIKDLTVKINHNFRPGDWHIILTYAGIPPTIKEAKKNRDKFIRDTMAAMRKEGTELKRIDVTEYTHNRIHHHVVMNYWPIEKIQVLWHHGIVKIANRLDKTGNYYRLARYLIKETCKTFREEGSPTKRRYNCSRNVVTPAPQREDVTERVLFRGAVAAKGYYIDQDTVRRYEHKITGAECLEFIMVSLMPDPRLKRWQKGRKVKARKSYQIPEERQLIFNEFIYAREEWEE